jgi:photosystem II PsbJ protein
MLQTGKIPLWIVATIAGLGIIALMGLFFYGAYAGVGSSL